MSVSRHLPGQLAGRLGSVAAAIPVPPRLFGLVLGVVVWTALATFTPRTLLPQLTEMTAEVYALFEAGLVAPNLTITLWRILWGFIFAMIAGVAGGVVMGINSFGQRFFTPYVILGLSIPAVAWAAIGTLIFGFSIWSPVFATMLTTFPFVAVNVWKGVEDIDVDLIEMSESFDVPRRRLLTRVLLPNTAPALFAASRFGLAISWKVVTVVEIFAASRGIGHQIAIGYESFAFDRIWAWAFLFFLVILAVEYLVVRPIERRVYSYRRDVDLDILG